MDDLSDVAVFVRVVERGSFTAAAISLGISKAGVSKCVGRLEYRLGARLLHRTTRRLTLTEAGEVLHARASTALADLREAQHDVIQLAGTPRGLLRISAPTYFGSVSLAPMLKDFRARYPEVTLDLNLDDRLVDLVQERFDGAIRIAVLTDSSLIARRLAPCPLVVVASPAYLARRGVPRTPDELRAHECLSYSISRNPESWSFRDPEGRWFAVPIASAIRCNNDFVLKQAAVDGLGLAMFPRFFVERELRGGTLAQVLRDARAQEPWINLVYATRRNLLPKLQVFGDFLAERLRADGASDDRTPADR